MPTVPRRDPSTTVDRQGLPNVQFTAAPTEETFGGGAAKKAGDAAIQNLASTNAKLMFQEARNMDKSYALSQDPVLMKIKNDAKIDISQNYALSESVRSPDRAQQYFDDTQEIIDTAPRGARGRIIKQRNAYANELNLFASNNMITEGRKWQAMTYESSINVHNQDAAANPYDEAVILRSYLKNEDSIAEYAKLQVIPKGSEVYQDLQLAASTSLHENVINALIADNRPDLARAYFEKETVEDQMFAERRRIMDAAIGNESQTAAINGIAKGLMQYGDDEVAVFNELAKIEDSTIRNKVEANYKFLRKQQVVNLNQSEAEFTDAITSGKITKAIQVQDTNVPVSNGYKNVAASTFDVKTGSIGSNDQQRKVYAGFAEKIASVDTDDLYEMSQAYSDLRIDVMANKGAFQNDEKYLEALKMTNPDYVKKYIAPKQGVFSAGLKKVIQAAMYTPNPYAATTNLGKYISKYFKKSENKSAKDQPEVTEEILKEQAIDANSALAGQPEPTNYVNDSGQINVGYTGESKAKLDGKTPDNIIKVIFRATGQEIYIPREKFNNERHKIANS